MPFLTWKWDEQIYTVGSSVALLLFLLMIFSVPPDPKSLSLDLFNSDNRFVKFLIKPPEEKEEDIPEWLKSKKNEEQGGKGKRHKGEEGKMGKKTSKNKEGLYGLKGPKDNTDPHLAKMLAEEQAHQAAEQPVPVAPAHRGEDRAAVSVPQRLALGVARSERGPRFVLAKERDHVAQCVARGVHGSRDRESAGGRERAASPHRGDCEQRVASPSSGA